MKKNIILIALVGMFSFCYCQNVDVRINNRNASTGNDCPYRINGICSSEDIGGVDVSIIYNEEDHTTWAVFTNYNKVSVTVLYEVGNNDDGEGSKFNTTRYRTENGTTGSIVIGANGSKKIKIDYHQYYTGYADWGYTYYDNSKYYSIKGLIVRKIKN